VAESSKNSYFWAFSRWFREFLRHLARVVFPEPDGPHKINEFPLATSVFKVDLRCVCPLNSSSDLGLTLSANGLLKVEGCELEGVGRQDLKEGSELRRDFFLD